jgi:hypothetical protein
MIIKSNRLGITRIVNRNSLLRLRFHMQLAISFEMARFKVLTHVRSRRHSFVGFLVSAADVT